MHLKNVRKIETSFVRLSGIASFDFLPRKRPRMFFDPDCNCCRCFYTGNCYRSWM